MCANRVAMTHDMNEALERAEKRVRFNPLNPLSWEMWRIGFATGWRAALRAKQPRVLKCGCILGADGQVCVQHRER